VGVEAAGVRVLPLEGDRCIEAANGFGAKTTGGIEGHCGTGAARWHAPRG